MDWKILDFFILLLFLRLATNSDGQSSHICTKHRIEYWTEMYCSSRYLWWCTHYASRQLSRVLNEDYCCPGWKDSFNQRCSVRNDSIRSL